MKATIMGSGAWGMGLASILQENLHSVCVWSVENSAINLFSEKKEVVQFPGVKFGDNVHMLSDLKEALIDSEFVILAIPVLYIRDVLSKHADILQSKTIVSASKGIEQITGYFVSEIVSDTIGASSPCGVLSGPNLAQDIIARKPCATTLAGDIQLKSLLLNAFKTPWFHPYFSTDIIGAQIGGSLKNIFAIIAGVASGLNYSLSSIATLLTFALKEMSAFAKFKNHTLDVTSFAGVGDLILTALSPHSRNHRFGLLVGKGTPPNEALEQVGTVEGYHSITSINNINAFQDMPISKATFDIVHDNQNPSFILKSLFQNISYA